MQQNHLPARELQRVMVLEGIVPEGQRATVLQLPALGGPERAEGKVEGSEPKRRPVTMMHRTSL